MRRGAVWDLNLTSRDRLLGNMKLKQILVWRDDEMVEFEIFRAVSTYLPHPHAWAGDETTHPIYVLSSISM